MNTEVAKLEDELADAKQELAETITELDATKKEVDAMIEYFDRLKADCKAKHEEWEVRKASRTEELEGIKKALEILTSDEARELFGKSIKPGMEAFLQLGSVTAGAAEMAGMRAFAALRTAAGRSHSLRLASLAAEVRTAKVGHFDKVIAAIDQMIQVLKDEEAGDIANRDQCKDEYQKIESKVKDLNWKIEKNEAKIDKLEQLIKLRTAEKVKTVEDIESTEKAIVQMEDQRQEENQAFLEAKSDDEGAIELLEKAKAALAAYYEKNKTELGPIQGSVKGALLQEPVFQVSEDQAPDATFSHMGSRKGGAKGIVSIITMVIEDLQA